MRPALRLGRLGMGAVLLASGAAVLLLLLPGRDLADAWLLAVVVLAGIAAGSLGLICIGHLLGRRWMTPVDDELRPAAFTLPLVLLLALPLGLQADVLISSWAVTDRLEGWFDPAFVAGRTVLFLLAWIAFAFGPGRAGPGTVGSALGIVLLLPTLAVAGIDWVLPRGPFWWSSLFGVAFAVSQLSPALALAFLANRIQREPVEMEEDRSLVSALMTLTLAAAGLWFVQFLTAYMGDLPEEAAWYNARLVGGRWIPLALAAAALGAAVLLLMQRHRGRWVVIAAATLILIQHFLHTAWLLRPVPTPALGLLDAVVLLLLGGIWAAVLWTAMERQDRLREAARQVSGRPGSS